MLPMLPMRRIDERPTICCVLHRKLKTPHYNFVPIPRICCQLKNFSPCPSSLALPRLFRIHNHLQPQLFHRRQFGQLYLLAQPKPPSPRPQYRRPLRSSQPRAGVGVALPGWTRRMVKSFGLNVLEKGNRGHGRSLPRTSLSALPLYTQARAAE